MFLIRRLSATINYNLHHVRIPKRLQAQHKTRRTLFCTMPTFFSLPPELRNMIYDILHQHEQELDSERLTFVMPLTHVRNVSRLFRDEYDKRSPRNSRLAISQGNWSWGQFTPARDAAYGRL
jgi:hypothetical protein